MNTDRFWRRLPPLMQFSVLCVLLPGVVAHEYVHALTGLLEGAESTTFDWGRAQVIIEWAGDPGQWTWIAPTLMGVVISLATLSFIASGRFRAAPLELVYGWIQFALFTYPSADDRRRLIEAKTKTS